MLISTQEKVREPLEWRFGCAEKSILRSRLTQRRPKQQLWRFGWPLQFYSLEALQLGKTKLPAHT